MIRTFFISTLLLAASDGAAIAAPPPQTPGEVAGFKEKGAYVLRAANESLPLYTFDRDQPGKSACSGTCALAWPPLAAPVGSVAVGEWTPVSRADGTVQWAWRGKPVYTFAKDMPEKATGDGLGGVWRLIPTIPAN